MKNKMIFILILIVFTLGFIPMTVSANVEGNITWTNTVGEQSIIGGTVDNPVIITIDGKVKVTGTITISSGYVKLVGDSSNGEDLILKDFNDNSFINVPKGTNLILEDMTVDGGAVWTGEKNEYLNRGTTNSGYLSANMFAYEGNITIQNCKIQNHDGSYLFNSNTNNTPENKLIVKNSVINNNNGGISWSRDYVEFTKTEIAYNSGSPSVIRGVTSSNYVVTESDIHHNYSKDGQTMYSYNGGSFVFTKTKIRDNVAKDGGAFASSGQVTYFNDCEIINNTATEKGGAFNITGGRGIRLQGNTIVSGNSSPKGSAVYNEQWFILEESFTGIIKNNKGSAAIYVNGSSSNISLVNGNFSNNSEGDIYIENYSGLNVNENISDLYISSPDMAIINVGKNSEFDLSQIANKIHYISTNKNDIVVPFIKKDGSAIQFAKVVLNSSEEYPARIMPFTTLAVNTLPIPAKDYKIFAGWYTDKELTNAFASDYIAGDTYYAKWLDSLYDEMGDSLKFDFGKIFYGENSPSSKSITFTSENPNASIKAIETNEYFTTSFENLTATVQPKDNLKAGIYAETINVILGDDSTQSIIATFIIVNDYKIIDGEDQEVRKGSEITFTSDADFEKFKDIKVDGKIIDKKHYSVEKGSTKVTLKVSYINTLTLGKHKVTIISEDGEASTEFTVKDFPNDEKIPNTGINILQNEIGTNIIILIVLLIISTGSSIFSKIVNQKINK